MAVGLYGLVQPGPQGEEGSSNQKGLARAARVGVSPGCPIENIEYLPSLWDRDVLHSFCFSGFIDVSCTHKVVTSPIGLQNRYCES